MGSPEKIKKKEGEIILPVSTKKQVIFLSLWLSP